VAVKRCVFSLLRKTFWLFAARTLADSLFHMFGTATLKARLPHAVRVIGTWSRGLCEERSDIEEPENWRGMSWWRLRIIFSCLIILGYIIHMHQWLLHHCYHIYWWKHCQYKTCDNLIRYFYLLRDFLYIAAFTLKPLWLLNGFLCADVLLRNYSLVMHWYIISSYLFFWVYWCQWW